MPENSSDNNSYKNILKGTSFFGGMQIFLILINLIRGKMVALILGPEGMGIANLFNTSSSTVQRFASLGLNLAIVKEVVDAKDDKPRFQQLSLVVTRLVTLTALIGCLFCILFSYQLSQFSFGSSNYSWQFMLLGAAVFFMIAGNGKLSILQGLHEVKAISISSIVGAIVGLVVSVPLYYFWGNKAIVPAILLFTISTYITYSLYLKKKIKKEKLRINWKDQRPLIKRLVSMGMILMASDLISSLFTYITSVFIRHYSDLDELGLYQAANSITSQYMGVVFSAMSLDYFPRLTEAASDNKKMTEIVNRQSLLVALVSTPLCVLLIAFTPLVIQILLSSEFNGIETLLRLFSIGVLFKTFSFAMGYIAFAKGNKRLFFILEGVYCNIQTLIFICAGFYFFGLEGLGYAMIADFLLCILVYYIVNRTMYGYRFSHSALIHYIYGSIAVIVAFGATLPEIDFTLSIIILSILCISTVIYSLVKLRKLMKS